MPNARTSPCAESSVGDFCVLRFYLLLYYLSTRLLPQRVQHSSAYPGSSVSNNKFQLLYCLLVSPHTTKRTKDNLKFHFTTQLNWQPHYSLLQACPTLTQERAQLCRLSGSLTGWILGLSVSLWQKRGVNEIGEASPSSSGAKQNSFYPVLVV